MSNGSVEQLLGFRKSDRTVRAYAYLTVALNVKQDVSDVQDCLLPFLASVIERNEGAPLNLIDMRAGLQEYGLNIPVYAIEQLLTRLARRSVIEWNQMARAYLPTGKPLNDGEAPPVRLTDAFDTLEDALGSFGEKLGVPAPPVSETWNDALIHFLRHDRSDEIIRAKKVKDVLIGDGRDVENFIVARFVQESQSRDPETFECITQVFTGVLIEDFVSNVQEIGSVQSYRQLKVYYDTGVLLRLLGTSGRLFQTATLEMHTALQSLGCDTHYLEPNAAEVQNILDTLEGTYNRGKEIYGETSDAIHNGEITIGQIKDLAGTFETRLAQMNIFPFLYDYSSRRGEDAFQIDEREFATALTSAAFKNDRGYSAPNANNDAHVIAIVIRLRRGKAARVISASHHIFVSRNSLLQRVARKFVDENVEEYDFASVPPVVTVGQVTTLAWLASNKAIESHKVSRELLASCYNAVQPTEAWADEFAKVINQFKEENQDFLAQRANAMLFLKSARAAARDESLNQPVMLRKLNVAEIFRKAAEDQAVANEEIEERQRQSIKELEEANAAALSEVLCRAAEELQAKVEATDQKARALAKAEIFSIQRDRMSNASDAVAHGLIILIQIAMTSLFIFVLITDIFNIWEKGTWQYSTLVGILAIISIISFMDMLGVKIVSDTIKKLRGFMSRGMLRLLLKITGHPEQQ